LLFGEFSFFGQPEEGYSCQLILFNWRPTI